MHSKRPDAPEVKPYLQVGQPLLEAQVVDACDSLAYVCHDVDDALSVGLITPAQVADVPFWKQAAQRALSEHPAMQLEQSQPTIVRKLIDWQVSDLLETARKNLAGERIATVADVRRCKSLLIVPSAAMAELKVGLTAYLHENVYRHFRVLRMTHKGQLIVGQLFDAFCGNPATMPTRYRLRAEQAGLEQTVCDYLAGMTDRFAQDEYMRLFQPTSFV
jgi:dGTPase